MFDLVRQLIYLLNEAFGSIPSRTETVISHLKLDGFIVGKAIIAIVLEGRLDLQETVEPIIWVYMTGLGQIACLNLEL